MIKIIVLFHLFLLCWTATAQTNEPLDYTHYHQQIVEAETLIASENYKGALNIYEELFENYAFVFLRDYQIATQLALFLKEDQKVERFLINGIQSGWGMKSIRKN